MNKSTLWDRNSTGTYKYDDLLKRPEHFKSKYGGVGSVKMMSPDEYLEAVAELHKTTKQKTINAAKEKTIERIKGRIAEGKMTDMIFIDYNDKSQEGRSRAVAAKKMGVKAMPVLVISPAEMED